MTKLRWWHAQTAARLARVEAIMTEGVEEEVAELVRTVADTVKLNADGSMNKMTLQSLATRAHSADPTSSVALYAQWLLKNNTAAFNKYDQEQTGQIDSDSIVFSARSFLHGIRALRARLQANPDHFNQAAARMRNNHQKVNGRRMRRQWIDVTQAKLVKHHAMRLQNNTLSLREQKEDQSSVAKILDRCSNEGIDCLRECIEQVVIAHRLVMKHAQNLIDRCNKNVNEKEENEKGLLVEKTVSSHGKVLSHEQVRQARKIFYEYAGSDARLDVHELSTCARKLGIFGLTEKEVTALFVGLDMNNNGFVDFGEFLELFNQLENDDRRTV